MQYCDIAATSQPTIVIALVDSNGTCGGKRAISLR
jgi:hypothetical protein